MPRPRLLIASNNQNKLRELSEILGDLPLDLVRPADLGLTLDVDESGSTYAENARIKARAYSQASGLPALADDSGIEVLAFGAWPGVHSVRFAGPRATDATRRQLILDRLAGPPPSERSARFVCAMVLALGQSIVGETEGVLAGTISLAERGDGGFGYDPIFIPSSYTATLAELPADLKNEISHRGRAASLLRPAIRALGAQSEDPERATEEPI